MKRKISEKIKKLDPLRRRYLVFAMAIFLCFAAILVLLFMNQLSKINETHAENTRAQILTIKRAFLEDTVNNTITYIDELKQYNEERFKNRIMRLKIYLANQQDHHPIEHIIEYVSSEGIHDDLVISIKDPAGRMLYVSPIAQNMIDLKELEGQLFYEEEVDYNGNTVYMGAYKSVVKGLVEDGLRSRVYGNIYFQDSYIWVNEVLDYQGGEDYAFRLIHPNLKETEGMLLSTDMEDVAGGRPYLDELNGINKDGELFFSYYFKKMDTDQVAEKLSYAKLYKEYDWIVAMGVYYDSLQDYIQEAEETSRLERIQALKTVALLAVGLLFLGMTAFLWAEERYYARSTQPLKDELETDLLTGAGSRKAGLVRLRESFRRYKEQGVNYSLLLLDLDDFKRINDTFGHDMGDRVLVRIVERIKEVIREDDGLYRWGGEEFIVLAKGTSSVKLDVLTQKILRAVSEADFQYSGTGVPTTISIGATSFIETDQTSEEALKRADDALYESKRNGKNRSTIVM
jgi:diguanylate cyclase (GGDEF)-like protein